MTSDRLTRALADRYRIEHELGAGGMATVFLAEDLKHDRKVAIKVLKPELAAVLGAERFVALWSRDGLQILFSKLPLDSVLWTIPLYGGTTAGG